MNHDLITVQFYLLLLLREEFELRFPFDFVSDCHILIELHLQFLTDVRFFFLFFVLKSISNIPNSNQIFGFLILDMNCDGGCLQYGIFVLHPNVTVEYHISLLVEHSF